MIERSLSFSGPASPGHTLAPQRRGAGDPCFQIDGDGAIWRTSLQTTGPVTARISRADTHTVVCQAWGEGAEEFAEARAFLHWLDERHFTFLGLVENRAKGASGHVTLHADATSGLGLLRAGSRLAAAEELIAPQEELDKYANTNAAGARLVVITKGNVRSTVHHAEYLDVISIKRFAADGTLEGVTPAPYVMGLADIGGRSERVRLYRDFDPVPVGDDGPDREVPDPYYGEAAEFERVLDLVEDGVQGLVAHCRGRLDKDAT